MPPTKRLEARERELLRDAGKEKGGRVFELPDWLDKEAWEGFKEMRRKLKKPMTERAERMILRKLENFRSWGMDPNEVLDQSTLRCWLDIYPLNDGAHSVGKAQISADDREFYKKLGLLQ